MLLRRGVENLPGQTERKVGQRFRMVASEQVRMPHPALLNAGGKTMAEFRKTTSEFKSTWEKEVDFAIEEETVKKQSEEMSAQQVARLGEIKTDEMQPALGAPEIKQIDGSAFKDLPQTAEPVEPEAAEIPETPDEPRPNGKQDWL